MLVLGIETSCDENAAAVVEDGRRVLSNVVATQADLHARFGGVVPEVASRQHLLTSLPVIEEALEQAGVGLDAIEAVAVSMGPGLAGALLVGVSVAKAVAFSRSLPLVGVNHLQAHIYANWLYEDASAPAPPSFPLIALVVSGGHTELVLMRGHGEFRRLGRTRDDAAGEAFDKVARILGLGYPGGPAVQSAAESGDASRVRLPRAWLRGSDDFSFSGLKTAVLRTLNEATEATREDVAASFQESAIEVLVSKTATAARRLKVGLVLLAGGVAANRRLREQMERRAPGEVRLPRLAYCTDNAAMVASLGYYRLQAGHRDDWHLDVRPNLRLV